MKKTNGTLFRKLAQWLMWVALAGVALQLFFVARIALMLVIAPESTAFMRSEVWRIAEQRIDGKGPWQWSAKWVPYDKINPNLKRAVMASEDAGFATHGGVDWDAIKAAWAKNERRQQAAEKAAAQRAEQLAKRAAKKTSQGKTAVIPTTTGKPAKVIGGSTITQQLAKNLLLSGERSMLRKGQELLLTLALEAILSKQRILEIYLNSVEWGEGIFGAEAAAQRYFKKPASQLSAREAARLAVMLPNPKFFETRQNSGYLARRTNTISARMSAVALP